MFLPTPDVLVNTTDAKRTLYILGAKSQNLRVPFTAIKNLIVADHVANFESGGSLFGGWPPLSPETKSSGTPLVKSGALRKEIGKKSGPGKKVRKWEVRVGVGTPDGKGPASKGAFYARFHQSGTKRGLPKRELVGITDKTEREGVEIIRRYLVNL